MRKPVMDSDPTRADTGGPAAAFAEVTPGTDVVVARKALAEAGVDVAVVVDDGRPVGVITAAALEATARPGMAVADVMDYEVVRLPPEADGTATLTAFTCAAWASLLRRRPFREREGEAPA